MTVNSGDFVIAPLEHFFKQLVYILGLEWRPETSHFVYYTSQRPDITLEIVRLVPPDFGRGIVGSAGLSVVEPILLGLLGHIHIPDLCHNLRGCLLNRLSFLPEKYICRLEIAVHNVHFVEALEALDQLHKYSPYFGLSDHYAPLLMIVDFRQ